MDNQNKLQYFNSKFQDILKSSQFLMMNQVADIIEDNKFDHISFLGRIPVSDVIANIFPIAGQTNTVIEDKYTQLFITKKIFDENYELFMDKQGGNYVIVNDYSEVFAGMVRCEEYFVLANSSIIQNKFPVYALINSLEQANLTVNSQDKKFEFYGLVRLGYLINPRGYTDDELDSYESEMGFKLRQDIRSYVKSTSILKYDTRLFHINLDTSTYLPSRRTRLEMKFAYPGEKTVTNIKFLARYKAATEPLEYSKVLADEAEHMGNIENGFLYLGSIKRQMLLINDQVHLKSDKKLFLLLNYDDCVGANYNFSIWTYSYDNKNFDKLLDYYDDNDNKDKYGEDEPEFDAKIHLKRDNIFETLKCTSNLSF
jgi:hypothetical protein